MIGSPSIRELKFAVGDIANLSIRYMVNGMRFATEKGKILEKCQKKSLNNVYYETFDDFKTGINDCLHRVETDYKTEIETLMKPNFQDLKKEHLLAL